MPSMRVTITLPDGATRTIEQSADESDEKFRERATAVIGLLQEGAGVTKRATISRAIGVIRSAIKPRR